MSIVAGEHSLSIDSGDEQYSDILSKTELVYPYSISSDVKDFFEIQFSFLLLNRHEAYSSRTQENDICLLRVCKNSLICTSPYLFT